MWKYTLILLLFINYSLFKHRNIYASAEATNIKARSFQLDFLKEVTTVVDQKTQQYLNDLLQQLEGSAKYASYNEEFQNVKNANQLENKIIFIKQLLDIKKTEAAAQEIIENYYTLRNVNFLKKLQMLMDDLHEERAAELRQMRVWELCRQFQRDTSEKAPQAAVTFKPPYSPMTKLVPLHEGNIGEALLKLGDKNHTLSLDINDFGRKLYERVKSSGAAIIDDYLSAIRKLLHEIIEERSPHEQHTEKLAKLIKEIDIILGIEDFYQKRQRLYTYMESYLPEDFEQFRTSEGAQEDLAEIFAKLNQKGLDLFLRYLFSNFEFLERLHEEWEELLPKSSETDSPTTYDADSKLLYDVHGLYVEFKANSESNEKYEAYFAKVKELFTKSESSAADGEHIYELLHNASQSVGAVTLSMIRSKCAET